MALQPQTMANSATIVDVIDRVLDKGLIINADIRVSLVGVELLEVKIRAALASFETAAKYGMELPSGTNTKAAAWKSAYAETENCPLCKKRVPTEELFSEGCPWCYWKSGKADRLKTNLKMELPSGTNTKTAASKSAYAETENCPLCKKRVPIEELFSEGCPWCSWKSGKADR